MGGVSGLRLAAFAAIGVLAALQWATLLAAPPTARLLGAVLAAALLGWALSWTGARLGAGRGWRLRLATAAIVLAAAVAALLVIGVPLRDLVPWGWDRLAAGIDVGLTGLGGSFDYPFDGPGEWSRLLLVGAIVPLTMAAALLTFRPGRDRGGIPVAGLVVLLIAFAIPAIARPTAVPLLWGAALLVLIAIWLWGERARTAPALALVAACGAVAIPVTSGLAAEEPALDYRSWALPGVDRPTTFDWDPSYGPINWPRTGELLFRVHTERPNFWRVAVLDEFHADGWRRSGTGGPAVPAEPRPSPGPAAKPARTQAAWFSIRDLASPLLISPGTALAFEGVDGSDRDRDGTTHVDGLPLEAGSSYSVTAWAPDPGVGELRAASRRYRPPLAPYTRLALPENASLEAIGAPAQLDVPLWGHQRRVEWARRRLAQSPYRRVAALAERLVGGARDGYEAAVAIANRLRTSYAYDERPPLRRLPLRAFLFRDRAGYCQQFSGAMALMLRMVGVPARVATGFAPGTPLASGRGFEVTDLDAHSWVEVYFNGIGWLPFDPTPPAAPASLEIRGGASFGTGLQHGGGGGGGGDGGSRAPAAAPAASGGGAGAPVSPLGALAVLAAAVLILPPVRSLRHRRLTPGVAAEREAGELRRVLRATGWAPAASTTLLGVEARLRSARRGAAAAYVRRHRLRLYGGEPDPAPTLAARRAARRDLAAGNGLAARLRLLWAMPPGAPAGSRGKRRR
jgi:transglutaminase-like putative cysteine protease